jgi:hypothetical protein
LRGLPIVGDFDGDGVVDLGIYRPDNNRFLFDLSSRDGATSVFGLRGRVNAVLSFGFPSVGERPVAADMDHDGITDIGLWVPSSPGQTASWYFLVSHGTPVFLRNASPDHIFTPAPLGYDLYFTFGNNFAIPLVGNFDPPLSPVISQQNIQNIIRRSAANVLLAADVQLAGSGSSAGLVSRYAPNGDMYWAGLVDRGDQFFIELRRRFHGRWTTLKSTAVTAGVGHVTFDTRGSTLRVYLNSQLIASVFDRALSRGFYGTMFTQGTIVSNFTAQGR